MSMITTTVILIEPDNAGNTGAICRAMKNFDFEDLVLVAPKFRTDSEDLRNRAKWANDLVDKIDILPKYNEKVLKKLRKDFDYIICDSPAGIEHGAMTALYHADAAIIVTNPEVSSVRDSDRIIGMLASKTRRAEKREKPVEEHLLLTRYSPARVKKGEMLSVEDVKEILSVPLLGIIPESESVLKASNTGMPVILDAESPAGRAYDDAVARYLGEQREMRFVMPERRSFLRGWFGRAAS